MFVYLFIIIMKDICLKKVLLIAGSPLCLERKRDLSMYDIIVKMNATPLNEYKDYITDRCDIWITSEYEMWRCLDSLSEKLKVAKQICYIHSKNNLSNISSQDRYKLENFKKRGKNIFRECCIQNLNATPSIGLRAIVYLEKYFNDITILGFTFGEGQNHFYDNIQIAKNHDFAQEKTIITNLINQGKLKVIS